MRIRNLKSKDGTKELPDAKYEITTKMSPMYCSVDDIKTLVDVFDIPESTILMMIRRAGKEADFINGKPVDTTNGVPFEVNKSLRPTPASAILDDWSRNGNMGFRGREFI